MGIIVNDTFTEASNTNLASHVPDTGTSWAQVVAPAAINWRVTSFDDFCQSDNDGVNGDVLIAIATPGPSTVNCSIEVKIFNSPPGNNQSLLGLVLGYIDTNNYYVAGSGSPSNTSDKRIYKVVAGVATSLGTADAGLATGDVLKFTRSGTSLSLLKNGTALITISDSALTSPGKCGIANGAIMGGTGPVLQLWRIDDLTISEPSAGRRVKKKFRKTRALLAM